MRSSNIYIYILKKVSVDFTEVNGIFVVVWICVSQHAALCFLLKRLRWKLVHKSCTLSHQTQLYWQYKRQTGIEWGDTPVLQLFL